MADDNQFGFYRDIQLNNGAMVVSVAGGGGGSGTSGTSGINGTSGTDGTSGSNGTSGTSGTGSSGTSGTAGTSGTSPVGGGATGSHFNFQLTSTFPYTLAITGVYEQIGIEGNSIWAFPFTPGRNVSITALNCDLFGNAAGGEIKLLAYSHNSTTYAPDQVLIESTVLNASTGGIKQYNVNYTFSAGTTYWLAIAANSSAGGIQMRGITQGSCFTYGVPTGSGTGTVYTMIRSYTFNPSWPNIPTTFVVNDKNGARIHEIRMIAA